MTSNNLKKAIRAVALSTTMLAATFGTAAYAHNSGNQEVEYGELHHHHHTPGTTNQGGQGGTGIGIGGQGGQGGKGGQGGTAISGAISGSNSSSSSNATAGANAGANASTGPVTATGGNSSATGGTSNATGGTSNASTGPVTVTPSQSTTVSPSQSTVNSFRSFVGTNAPNLSGSVDGCLAVLGWSAAVNVFGATGVGIGGGSQHTQYVEQCAAVKSAFEVWNRAGGDVAKETFAIQMLIDALPTYGKPAMEQAVKRINTYIEKNGDNQPTSVMSIFGAKSFKSAPVVALNGQQPVANNNGGVTLNVYPVVQTRETVRTVAVTPKKHVAPKPAVKKPDCK